MTDVSDNQQESSLVEGKDFIVCNLCNKQLKTLAGHLSDAHNGMRIAIYKEMFPGERILCDSLLATINNNRDKRIHEIYGVSNISQLDSVKRKKVIAMKKTIKLKYGGTWITDIPGVREKIAVNTPKGHMKKFGCMAPKLPEVKAKIIASLRKTNLCRYGVIAPAQLKEVREKMKRTCIDRYGVPNAMQNIDLARKNRIRKRPSGEELTLKNFLPKYIKYTGNGKFWVAFLDGSLKNPDFVVRPFRKWRKVIELHGDYWHKGEDITILQNKYKQVNVNCLIIWGSELQNIELVKSKIQTFLQEKPSETIRQIPEKEMI